VAEAAAAYQGVGTVWLVEDPAFEHPLVEQMGAVIAQLAHDFDYIVMASTTLGKNVLPRVAGLLDLTQVSDVSVVVSADTFGRPIYAGNALETVQILDKQKILSIRVTSFNATMAQQSPCLIQKPAVQVPGCATSFVGRELSQSVRPDLANAKIIGNHKFEEIVDNAVRFAMPLSNFIINLPSNEEINMRKRIE
jgi:electron transfer flavoprotein alpha subunit